MDHTPTYTFQVQVTMEEALDIMASLDFSAMAMGDSVEGRRCSALADRLVDVMAKGIVEASQSEAGVPQADNVVHLNFN